MSNAHTLFSLFLMNRAYYEARKERLRKQNELSDIIKSSHRRAQARGEHDDKCDSSYSSAMFHLANDFWESSERKEDRNEWILDAVENFFMLTVGYK